MRFMLLQNYGPVGSGAPPMDQWTPEDAQAHVDFQHALNRQLFESGELIEVNALTGPDQATFVTADGVNPPVMTDGPYPESKELLAGYRLIDVESRERALEIAAEASAVPGPDGVPCQVPMEVREIMWSADPEM